MRQIKKRAHQYAVAHGKNGNGEPDEDLQAELVLAPLYD